MLTNELATALGDASQRDRAQWAGVFGALTSLPHQNAPPKPAVIEQRFGELLAKADEISAQTKARQGSTQPIANPRAVFAAWLKRQGWLLTRRCTK